MHIEFKRLVLHNFISFGHSELTFNDDGFVKVSGINENPFDLATSNGSGKSSLWEALIWALTGDTIRGTKQVSNLYGEDGTYVELEFNIDNSNYNIIRAKEHKVYKTSLQIIIDGKDCSGKGIRDSEKLLQQYLPDLTASLLGSVIILGQGLPQKFTNNSPSGRKEVLEKLSKSDFMIEDLKRRVADRKSDLTKQIRTCEDSLLSIQSKRTILLKQIEDAKTQLSIIDRQQLESQLPLLEQSIDKMTEVIELASHTLNKINEDKDTLNGRLQREQKIYTDNLTTVSSQYDPQLTTHRKDQAELSAHIQLLSKQIKDMQNITDVCPTCGQKLVGVEKPDPTSLIEECENLKKDYQELTKVITDLTEQFNAEKQKITESFNLGTSIINNDLTKLGYEYTNQSNILRNHQADLNKVQQEYNNIKNQLASLDATINSLNTTVLNNEQELTSLQVNEESLTVDKETLQLHLDVINKFDTALKRDFRGYLLSTIIEYIAARAKQYSKMIFDTDLVEFQLDGNNIDISYMEKAYENLSGGEKQKIDLIIQFSIRDMLCNHLGFTSNILVLDEVFDGLDMIGCQRVLDVISNISDIKNIFIVTHRKDLSIPCDRELVVVKSQKGISEIR